MRCRGWECRSGPSLELGQSGRHEPDLDLYGALSIRAAIEGSRGKSETRFGKPAG